MKRLLVANRSEIAIRIFRAATELGLTTIAVYADQDKLSLHRFKADEAYLIGKTPGGEPMGPIDAYLSIDEIMRVAREARADAIHPGYGFLSESPEFVDACKAAGIVFIGPSPGDDAHARQQGVSPQPRRLGRRAGDAGDRAAAGRRGRDHEACRRASDFR